MSRPNLSLVLNVKEFYLFVIACGFLLRFLMTDACNDRFFLLNG